jgi:hypothetical protein
MRSDFEQWFSTTHPLRELAADIASLGLGTATGSGVWTAKPPPWNLMSNGIAAGWRAAAVPGRAGWVKTKGGTLNDQGFSGQSWGLGMLFDPFVDATIWSCCSGQGPSVGSVRFSAMRVIVLTDYSPISGIESEVVKSGTRDYGEDGARDFLVAKDLGTSGCNLVKCVTGKRSVEDVRKAIRNNSGYLAAQFSQRKILIWNFFPFQRGGVHCQGTKGLPSMQNSQWLHLCCDYLERFLQAVSATSVIWAVNKDVPRCPLAHSNRTIAVHGHPYGWGKPGQMPTL